MVPDCGPLGFCRVYRGISEGLADLCLEGFDSVCFQGTEFRACPNP